MFDANMWNQTKADGFSENETPEPGSYTVTIAEAKYALTGEGKDRPTIVVAYRTADGKQWADVKTLTSEGRIKSAKILMRDLGLDPDAMAGTDAIHAALKSLEGQYFDVTVADSNAMNTTTGMFYRNTSIIGRAQAQAPAAPAPVPAAVGATSDAEIPF